MQKFRKRPVVIEAMQFTEETKDRCHAWVTCTTAADFVEGKPVLRINTLEGAMTASLGDWIIKGVQGEFYPCKPEIFSKTYEPVDTRIPSRGNDDVCPQCGRGICVGCRL